MPDRSIILRLFLRVQRQPGNTGSGVLRSGFGAILVTMLASSVLLGCSSGSSSSKSDRAVRAAADAAIEPISPVALMDPGDEIDDNIWVRRPRNRLQPGQTVAPDPASRTVAQARGESGANSAADRVGPSDDRAGAAPSAPVSSQSGLADMAPPQSPGTLDTTTRSNIEQPRSVVRNKDASEPQNAPEVPPARVDAPPPPRGETGAPPPDGEGGKPTWSIALATFSGDDHRATADAACLQFVQHFPDLKGAFVRSRSTGSVIMWGAFDGPKDPRARPALDQLKQTQFGGGRPFARAMLARMEQFSEEEMGPWDLRQVRVRHPNVRVIYTLQVAAWSDLGSGTIKFEEIRRKSEDYCRQLRSKGAEAWYHHDADQLTSIVTVGVFGSKAYDPQSTLYAPEVETLRRRFPTSLLNGEELRIKGDPSRPDETIPQPSRLVEVPR